MAITPVLPVPLTGPAYFVSHGGEAFPTLIVVLQGYGVTVEVVGSTFISSRGLSPARSSRSRMSRSSSFELVLSGGPVLGACCEREPLQGHHEDSDRIRRAERRDSEAIHSRHCDGLLEGEAQEEDQAQEE